MALPCAHAAWPDQSLSEYWDTPVHRERFAQIQPPPLVTSSLETAPSTMSFRGPPTARACWKKPIASDDLPSYRYMYT
ncbi:MAG: hypothetical protein QOE58_1516 [Actinomycetota bacterium]|jgi:hypothetical protein|nr:hypothetical protein [Actinomycetota bacterium]